MTSLEQAITAVATRCVRTDVAIDRDTPFARLGLDSLASIELAAALETELGCELPADVLAECRNVRALADRITRDGIGARAIDPAAQMSADARLPQDVTPVQVTRRPTDLASARHILLTGATGFLGSALVEELLARTDATISCLVRPGRSLPAAARVRHVEGDLTHPRLGLSGTSYNALVSRIDAVVHCGAAVNWVFSYAGLREANVIGTVELLRLACRAGAPFHFVSSISVCYPQDGPATADERFDALPHVRGVHLGYAQTKVVGEALVRQAGERGLPVRIYRPALISGHSDTGAFNRDDLIATLVRGCVAMGTAPDLDWTLDAVPVDVVARSILALSRESGPAFHIGHPHPRHWRECVLWMRLYGYNVRLVSYPAWLRQLERETKADATHPLRPLRSFFADRPAGGRGLTLPELYEDRRRTHALSSDTHARLAAAQVRCPALDASLLDTYFAAFIAAGALPLPGSDQGQTGVKPGSNGGQTGVKPGSDRGQTGVRPGSDRGQTGVRPGSDRGQTGVRPQIACPGHVGRVFRPSTLISTLRAAGHPVRSVEILSTGSAHSIVSELTAWRSQSPTGLFHARATMTDGSTRQLMVKLKARDADVIAVGEALADVVDPRVGEPYLEWSAFLGFTQSHAREVAIFRQEDPRFRAHTPAVLATVVDEDRGTWMVIQERLDDARLLDSVDRPDAWTRGDIAVAVEGLAALHAIWFGRDADLLAQPWIGHVHTSRSMAAMAPLWTALADHAAPLFSEWSDPGIAAIHQRLAKNPADWWSPLDAGPRTLIHGDFNPRNVCLRGTPAQLCAYDWELASLGAPQRDLAEFLCFVLPADAAVADVEKWIEMHRSALSAQTGASIDPSLWMESFRSALCDLLVNRLSVYAMVHRVRAQPFLPRVVRTWRQLHRALPGGRL